jgi:thiosulfate/3-mercaptopyruvate sulfurtransferase
LEPWEKVIGDAETYPDTVHGQIACQACHGGVQSADKAVAHEGLIPNPSNDPEANCGECHPDVVAMNETNLHTNLDGYWTVLNQRTAPEDHETIVQMFGNHCNTCHASCGECHVSQPNLVGGGLIDGHNFSRTPSMTRNCTACHGSRVGNEYLGKHEDLRPDVHFRQGRMSCVDCHTSHEMHGQPAECETCHTGPEAVSVAPADHRYDGVQSPRCETCHTTVAIGQDDITMHQQHGGDLSCQVCHSISYTSCDGCHVAISETTGNPFYATDGSYLTFKIGRNPRQSYDRPYEYVILRHVPVAADSFAFYGDDLLPNLSDLPTWVYATPHNIQRETPQTESCGACHGNADLFLTIDDIAPEEIEANLAVIVDAVPLPVAEYYTAVAPTVAITTTTTVTTTEETP